MMMKNLAIWNTQQFKHFKNLFKNLQIEEQVYAKAAIKLFLFWGLYFVLTSLRRGI